MRYQVFGILALGALLFAGCTKESLVPEEAVEHTVRLTLDGRVAQYDAPDGTKAAAALTWTEDDRIYVRTSASSGPSTSIATYQPDGTWSFSYYGSLTGIQSVQCVYIQNAQNAGHNNVSLNYNSVVFEDKEAKLAVGADGSVTLSTYLKPKIGRLSFRSTGQESVSTIGLSGLAWYSSFELSDFSFRTTEANVADFPVGSQFYFYGFFSEESGRKMIVWNGTGENRLFFSRTFGEAVLRSGASGYLEVPTHNQYDGWKVENPENLDAYVPIVFEDANFKNWLLQRYDSDGDGEISRLEGRSITSIDNARGVDVSSLKGIEYFPNLQRLVWSGYSSWDSGEYEIIHGQLSSIDLSANTLLEYLDLHLNQLTSLDVSHNSSLRSLEVMDNQISELNLTGCVNLESLWCYGNNLTEMNVSDCSSLVVLNCSNNQLTSIDVSGCPDLRELSLADNKISSVDLSPAVKLESFDCGNTLMTSLEVRCCPHLRWLQVSNSITSVNVSGLSELQSLYMWGCPLTSLNVQGCVKLEGLYLSCEQLTELDVSGLSSLRELYCYYGQLTSLDLSGLTALQVLHCEGNQITTLALPTTLALREVYCNDNKIETLDLSGRSSLETLYCQNNALETLTLQGNVKLNYLDCSTNRLSALNLGSCQQLVQIHCGWNPFETLDVSMLPVLQGLWCEYSALTTLDLISNNALTCLDTHGSSQLATIYVKTGHSFPEGLNIDDGTEIVSPGETSGEIVAISGLTIGRDDVYLLDYFTDGSLDCAVADLQFPDDYSGASLWQRLIGYYVSNNDQWLLGVYSGALINPGTKYGEKGDLTLNWSKGITDRLLWCWGNGFLDVYTTSGGWAYGNSIGSKTASKYDWTAGKQLQIGGLDSNWSFASYTFYGLRIYRGDLTGTPVAEYIPAYKDGVLGLYNSVSGTFITKQ